MPPSPLARARAPEPRLPLSANLRTQATPAPYSYMYEEIPLLSTVANTVPAFQEESASQRSPQRAHVCPAASHPSRSEHAGAARAASRKPTSKRSPSPLASAPAPKSRPLAPADENVQAPRAPSLAQVRVSPPASHITHASAPLLVSPRVSAPPFPIAQASAPESRPCVSPAESVQASHAPLRTFVRVSSSPPLSPKAAPPFVQ